MNMETPKTPEQREQEIDRLIEILGEKEGMNPEDVLSDMITFASYEGNDSENPAYMEQVAEMLEISVEELNAYAVKKMEDMNKE